MATVKRIAIRSIIYFFCWAYFTWEASLKDFATCIWRVFYSA